GTIIAAIPSELGGTEPLVTNVPLDRVAAARSEDFYVLLGQVDRSANPDDGPPGGALEVQATGLLGRGLVLAYAGLVISAERVKRVQIQALSPAAPWLEPRGRHRVDHR